MVIHMQEMGFDFEVALEALQHSKWDLNRAVATVS
jgi:hypothetical protein